MNILNFLRKVTFLLAATTAVFWNTVPIVTAQSVMPYIIQLPENENAVLVEKKTQTFFLLSGLKNEWKKQLQVPCSTGEVSGVKLRAGDKKTPEGIYFIKDEYEDKYLTPVYGKKAFPLDYPNFIDKRDGKNGSAIWIHGTNKILKPMDSNGCIALENKNVMLLSDYVSLDSTPVILVEEIEYLQNNRLLKEQKKRINNLVNQWTRALQSGTYQTYLSYYSPLYLPEIDFWPQWRRIREKLNHSNKKPTLVNENLGIYFHNDVFVALFKQSVTIGAQQVALGKRKLFLSALDDKYEIIGDEYQFIPEALDSKKAPLVSALEAVLEPRKTEEQIVDVVKSWLAAWSAKKMDVYASFYAGNFYSDGMNKKQWVDRKKRISKKYSYISVTGSRFNLRQKKDTCTVNFFQTYESSGFVAKGKKQLKLIKVGGSWKIFQENWKKK